MLLLALFLTSIIAMILLSLLPIQHRLQEAIAVTSSVVELIIAFSIITIVIHQGSYTITSFFAINALGGFILGITSVVGLFATLHSVGYLRGEQAKKMIGFMRIRECYILMRLFLLFMYLAITTSNPIIMWIAIEATTLSTVFLISFFNRNEDIEAAWKYLIINSVGLLLGLLGTLLFLAQGYSASGFITWNDLLHAATHMNLLMSKLAFIFILIGFGTKMGLVPMHTWKPDTYNKAPLPIVALLSGALLNVAFLAILRFKLIIDSVAGGAFSQTLFLFFGVISIVIPSFIIYTQSNYKRLLAYSTIENAGIMMLGFGFGGIGILGALLHMMYHAFAKAFLFLASSNIALKYSSSKIKDVSGMFTALPYTSGLYVIGLFLIVGMPPSGIFFSEFYILLAGLHQFAWISVLVVICILFVFAGYFRQVFGMLFGIPRADVPNGEFSWWTLLPITVLAAILIVLGFYLPEPIQILLKESTALFTHSI